MSKSNPEKSRRLAIIASKGTLDWAYPPFILGSAAAAMGWEVGIFFTFYGLTLLRPNIEAQVSPLGNPAMPMKMPFGSDGFQAIGGRSQPMMTVPGFNALATGLMKKTFANKGVAAVSDCATPAWRWGA
jgi:peroxiredoxin family protein